MNVLLDTNVILELMLERDPRRADAEEQPRGDPCGMRRSDGGKEGPAMSRLARKAWRHVIELRPDARRGELSLEQYVEIGG